ncbi:GntR family transcriptional regulator [Pararhizobium mangrovi]|uniref:GntR family transcriptional regulator n=1 Tax=Pararhizobium mangrovi TaxID=2590452 RepID=A0A506UBZ1_9HYPH|nr:GntR family transcriptional regulator [Pararhizobium mangrovi]
MEPAVGFKPLYAQVKDRLIRRLVDGTWPPGMALPSEFELAQELKVSQGTVRKALDAMTSENLLVRRQGRGTFVTVPEESRILFQFFHLKPDSGTVTFPQSTVLKLSKTTPTAAEAEPLALSRRAKVWRIERVRSFADAPIIVETITLPVTRFEGLDTLETIPNNVYELYSKRWGITIAQSEERLKAISASARDASHLKCPEGEPLLLISRLARDLEAQPVELRWSRCLTRTVHYGVKLR